MADGREQGSQFETAYEMVGEYLDSGVLPAHAYALTAARLGLSVADLVKADSDRSTAILQEQRDRGER